MNRILLVFGFVALLLGCQRKDQLESVTINVNSIVCGTCARTIEKAVAKVEGVKEINVDLDKKIAQVKFIPTMVTLDKLENAITGVGYDANDKKRSPQAYENLDACCKIDS